MPPKRNNNIYDVYERIMAIMVDRLDQFGDKFANRMNDMMNPRRRGDHHVWRSEGEESENPFFKGDDSSLFVERKECEDDRLANDDYEEGPVFDDDPYEEEIEVVEGSEILEVMFPLLEEFSDVFLDELPVALPPLCDIQHHIDLEPSSQFPNMSHYRLCPEEHEELRKQVEEFVSNGHIRKIISTCAQPRGPLNLMSLHVSGFVPKKVQNFVEGLPYYGDSFVDDLVGNSRTNFVYPWGNDAGPSVEEQTFLFLDA
nr:putative reverse transcriptase domain-containing protein [Tanacetum cinerariifolium]